MDRIRKLNPQQRKFFEELKDIYDCLTTAFQDELNRSVSFGDVLVDRWERAKVLGFGNNSSLYDSSLVIGNVKVGMNCWIGPFTILDGSGELEIGDFSTISAGVHIYSHDNIKSTLTSGQHPIERSKVTIGNNTYIAPNSIITRGVSIGNFCVIATGSFVNKSFENYSIVAGTPAKKIGTVKIDETDVYFEYHKKKK